MSQPQKILFLARHAKSSWEDAGLADIDRPLNKRGMRDAPRMGRWLAAQTAIPELVISSPANRARTTAGHLAAAVGISEDAIRIEDDVYFKGAHGMLRALQRVDDRYRRVMMVGHNPVMTQLLNQLTDSEVWNMPTCAIAIVVFDMPSWGLVDSTDGDLLAYQTPKALAAEG